MKARLLEASRLIRNWSKNNGKLKMPKQWTLSSKRLSLKGGKFVHFVGKAWQCKVVLNFLVDFVAEKDVDPMIKTLVWAAQNFLGVLSQSRDNGVFLEQAEAEQVKTVGMLFVDCYLRLRVKYEGWCLYRLFNIRPKVHLLVHVFTDTVHLRNVMTSASWMDEDFLRHVMRLGRKTHQNYGG